MCITRHRSQYKDGLLAGARAQGFVGAVDVVGAAAT
jgi:hypothetical protein